ncbi:MAG: hypothetical protein NTV77_03700 [Candidatus Azambacteria bacterium]|nr:hypothetical protein [Candidatus Azambacteria bacterium]
MEKPAYLPAVHGIAGEAVELPTDNALRFALFYAGEHFVEDGTAGNFSRLLFNKFLGNV